MSLIEIINLLSQNIGLLNNFLLLAFFGTFAHLFMKENKNDKSPIQWTDLLVDSKTKKLATHKLGQFWGISISSWIVIYMAQKLSPEQIAPLFPWVFGLWLTFLVSNAGIKAFSANKDEVKFEAKEDPATEETK